jgi:serine/threonine-protein kinase
MIEITTAGARIRVVQGDIVHAGTEAIVNAANKTLSGGSGVDGAIHRAAGPELYELTDKYGWCPTGSAVITGAGRIPLPTRYILHAVGPIYSASDESRRAAQLADAYRACMRLCAEHKIASVAFPSISTGVYDYPIDKAASIAIGTVLDELRGPGPHPRDIVFVLFSTGDLHVYEEVARELTAGG